MHRVKRSIHNHQHLSPYQQQLQRHRQRQQQYEQYQRELREREMRERQRTRTNTNYNRDARQYQAMMQQQPQQQQQFNNNMYHYQHHYQNSMHHVQQKNSDENKEYTIEVLVAVDKKMQEYHGKNLKNYVLTLMSVVCIHYSYFLNAFLIISCGYNVHYNNLQSNFNGFANFSFRIQISNYVSYRCHVYLNYFN